MPTQALSLHDIKGKIKTLPNRPPFMLTQDLADIYETDRKQISQAVLRNPERFPEDFAFMLSQDEIGRLQNEDTPHLNGQTKARAFTRMGANMLSAVLASPVAAARSVQIMRAFSLFEDAAPAGPDGLDAFLRQWFQGAGFRQAGPSLPIAAARYVELLEAENRLLRLSGGRAVPPAHGRPYTAQDDAEIARLAAQGLGSRRIARALGRSHRGVESRRRRLAAQPRH